MKKIVKYSLFIFIIIEFFLFIILCVKRVDEYIDNQTKNEHALYEKLNQIQSKMWELKEINLKYSYVLQNYTLQKTSMQDNLMNNAVNSSYALKRNSELYVFNLGSGDDYGSLYFGNLENYTIKSCNTINGRCLMYKNKALYFISSGEQYIKKYDLKTKITSNYVNMHSDNLVKMDNYIYFIDTRSDNYCPIHKKNVKTNKISTIDVNCGPQGSFCIDNDQWIYFTNNDDEGVYKIQTNGKNLKKISEKSCSSINIDGEWVYYTVNSKHNGMGGYIHSLYRIKKDGTDETMILNADENNILYFNVYNGWIYYVDGNKEENIFRITVDGLAKQKLCDFQDCYGLTIIDEKIIFRSSYAHNTDYTYIMDLDGKHKRMFFVNK